MRRILVLLTFISSFFNLFRLNAKESASSEQDRLAQESTEIKKRCLEYLKFYEMPENQNFVDITENVLNSPLVHKDQKKSIRALNRKFFVFRYPSDGLKIKGLISFVKEAQQTLLFLRGGNKIFGIVNPGMPLMCAKDYTIIATMYRGGAGEGTDEFGGEDLNDVKNLINFIPHLEKELGISIQTNNMFLLGASRGGMQMFLALARFPELQTRFSKIVSLCGLLDMEQHINARPDMEEMFGEEFGLIKGSNEEAWINKRNPLLAVEKIRKDLPILIIQGTADNRINLQEGYNMVRRLQTQGNQAIYWEIEGGNHGLRNKKEALNLILDWLEQ